MNEAALQVIVLFHVIIETPVLNQKTMRIITTQQQTFADSFINIPNSKLDMINKIIDWRIIAKELELTPIKTDYSAVSLFKTLLIGTLFSHS